MLSLISNKAMKVKATFSFISYFLVIHFHCGGAVDKLKLSSGYEIPVVGLGSLGIQLDETILDALESGYRHIDTAFAYSNEAAIGSALQKWFQKGGKREDLFITSKLPVYGNRPESVEKYLNRSLQDLGLDYVDMYLIHAPVGFKEVDNFTAARINGSLEFEVVDHTAVWRKMEEQVMAGRTKSIGLSNFNQSHILHVYNNARIKPSNLQIESNAYFQRRELWKFCKEKNIVVTAYAPLGSPGERHKFRGDNEKLLPALTDLPEIKSIAEKYNKTAGQVLLRHLVQAGLVVIPKSSNKDRQKANIDIFDFSLREDDVEKINALDKGEKGRAYDFRNFVKGIEKHPQFSSSL